MASNHISFDSEVSAIPGIGPSYEKKLNRLGIATIRDLLHHYPTRFLDYTKHCLVKDLKEKQNVSLKLTLSEPSRFMSKNGKLITQVVGHDTTGKINLIWFNSPYISRLIKAGDTYLVAGKTSFWVNKPALVAPIIESYGKSSLHTHGLVPIYPLTENVTSRFLRTKIRLALQIVPIPKTTKYQTSTTFDLPTYENALNEIHFPKNLREQRNADRRLSFDSHLASSIENQLLLRSLPPSVSLSTNQHLHQRLMKSLPFKLTKGQEKAIQSSYLDLTKNSFTHRLIQGETGSGKTVIVFFIAAAALAAKKSFCLLAPTEILANQHHRTFLKFGLPREQVFLVTGQNPLAKIPGKPAIFIGTHALLNQIDKKLKYPLCALVVDEQHRFGVKQRDSLMQRNPLPHLFNLTATPIPRTLALGLFGDIQISTLKEKPKERLPIKTWLIDRSRFKKSATWLKEQIQKGGKIFAVAPVITETETKKEIENVLKLYKDYQKMLGDTASIFLIHGQMRSEEIEKNLNDFAKERHGVLVSTSMIEVGVDIPDADVIIIHSAANFGLASLHQLRGRVGRGNRQGYCLLIDNEGLENERLKLLAKYSSGLTLAKMDLRLRGAGELSGLKQHGRLPVRLRYFWNKAVYQQAKKIAQKIVEKDPQEAIAIASRLATC